MYKYHKIKKSVFLLLCFVCSVYSYGQTLEAPVLDSDSNCNSPTNTSIDFTFAFSGVVFPDDNTFTIQLSDDGGDFVDVGTVPKVIDGKVTNTAFRNIKTRYTLSPGSYGDNYRIRLVSSNPVMEGPASNPFEAYYIVPETLILNEDKSVFLCGGTPQTISLNTLDPAYRYIWTRNSIEISGETGASISVSQEGDYRVSIDYGTICSASGAGNRSKIIEVTSISPTNLRIEGEDTIDICANETYELVGNESDPKFTYKWFKDNVEITGITGNRYTPPIGNQFGIFRLEIEIGGCMSKSQDVVIKQKTDAGFEVKIIGNAIRVRLPRETPKLFIEHDSSSATIAWFLNGVEKPGSNSLQWDATEEGTYVAVVTDNSSSCPVSSSSPEFTVINVVGITPTIRQGADYSSCGNESTDLSLVGIKAEGSDGNEYDLTEEQINDSTLIDYKWFKDGVEISGQTGTQLSVASYNENGKYSIEAAISASISTKSDEIDVLLTLVDVEIMSSSVSNKLCPGGEITFNMNIIPGFNYKWFKDGVELTVADPSTLVINEIGIYNVTFEGFGCLINVPEIEVVEFDESVLEVSPSSTAVLSPGETIRFEATGADSYEWYNEAGVLLSSSDVLEIDILGTYRLVGSVDACRAERELNVVEDDGKLMIPNIITPFNLDGFNDTWQLPNRFAFQTDVQIIIYDSRGQEVLNTKDYQNDWPLDNDLKDGMLFYFKVIREEKLIKAGTISILQ